MESSRKFYYLILLLYDLGNEHDLDTYFNKKSGVKTGKISLTITVTKHTEEQTIGTDQFRQGKNQTIKQSNYLNLETNAAKIIIYRIG